VDRAIAAATMMVGDNRRREAWDNEAERAVTQAAAAAAANRNAERRQNMAMAEELARPLSLSLFIFFIWSGSQAVTRFVPFLQSRD